MAHSVRLLLALTTILTSFVIADEAGAQSDRLVILVRHAEAGGEPEHDPPLTDRGVARAQALAQAVRDTEIGAVIVSSLARTRLTAAPLLDANDLTPLVIDVAGGIDAHVRATADAIRAQPGGAAVLVVGHSNTVPLIIAALGGPAMDTLCHGEFANFFVLHVASDESPSLVRTLYGEHDEPGAAECQSP